ncbi:LexA family protein [Flavobacterium sp.]|uniref:LexA family protein n=1 Tax=Flavobacterium sp. TaxID=239 RepID=UPI003D0DFDCB
MSTKDKLTFFKIDTESQQNIPFIPDGVSAGFPSPAADFNENTIDLNKELCENPLATFYIKVKGNSMMDAGIHDGDILVVDKSIEARDNKIAVCFIDGEFTVKRIKIEEDCLHLVAENPSYPPIKVTTENQFMVWGIVTYTIKKM